LYPALQRGLHIPPLHSRVPFGVSGQRLPQPPQ
jgi:hypothetical protein